MRNDDIIKHEGIVTDPGQGKPIVKILSKSACAACHAKGACGLSDLQEKVIEVENTHNIKLYPGDRVNVTMRTSLGVKAVLWGYLYPFFIVIAVLFSLLIITKNEGLSAIVALLCLVPWYLILSKNKDRFNKRFHFELEPFTD